jgi:hypothetical protein
VAAPLSTTTTSFFFTTEFANRATNPQLFTLNSGVFGSMVSQLNRSVLVGLEATTSTFNNVNITTDNELLTNTLAANRKSRVCYEATSVAATDYVLLIDLSDTTTWPHEQTGSIDIDSLSATITFASGTAEAIIRVGVVSQISGTQGDVTWLCNYRLGAQSANDSQQVIDNFQPSSVQCKITGGAVVGAISNVVETNVAAINTGAALNSPAGSTIPAVGDVLLKLEYVADTFSANLDCLYHSDA